MSTLLAMVPGGETRTVRDFKDAEDMKRHLQDLGLIKGEKVRVAGESVSGVILMVKGIKIVLNRGLVSKVMVEDQS